MPRLCGLQRARHWCEAVSNNDSGVRCVGDVNDQMLGMSQASNLEVAWAPMAGSVRRCLPGGVDGEPMIPESWG